MTVISPFLRADQVCTNSSQSCPLLSICTTAALERINLSNVLPYYPSPARAFIAYWVNIKFLSTSSKTVLDWPPSTFFASSALTSSLELEVPATIRYL